MVLDLGRMGCLQSDSGPPTTRLAGSVPTLLPTRGDPVEMDLIALEAVLPLAADGIDRPILAQHLDPGITRCPAA